MMKCDVCGVLCFVNAWKINVTCLVKGFIQKWLERSKIHALNAFSAVCPPDVLYLSASLLFLSLSLPLVVVVSTTY